MLNGGNRMRAWKVQRHGEPGQAIALGETDIPEPNPDEVRIRVDAAALGLPDVFMCRGTYPFKPELPFTPGQEVAGVVTAAGANATTPVGARVMALTSFYRGFGGFAEEALAPDSSTFTAPEEMDPAEAACFVIPYHTASLGIETRGQLRPGETLLVLGGAGGTGTAAIQLGRAIGGRVIAVAGGKEKVEVCRRCGADVVIDHSEVDVVAAVKEATGRRGADVIYDPVGGEAFDSALRCIANEGRLLAIGYASGAWHNASTETLVRKNVSVVGVFVGAYGKPFLEKVHDRLLARWRDGAIRGQVEREIPLEEVSAALERLGQRRSFGKTVVRVRRNT
jgi:NADPH2:quinone reductase